MKAHAVFISRSNSRQSARVRKILQQNEADRCGAPFDRLMRSRYGISAAAFVTWGGRGRLRLGSNSESVPERGDASTSARDRKNL